MDLTISRAEWLRGEKNKGLLLRPADGKRCCVGIYLRACGVPDRFMQEIGCVSDVPTWEDAPAVPGWLIEEGYEASKAAESLYRQNDDPKLTEAERERSIAGAFAEHGVTVAFTD